jgi:hypothetical protein
MSSPTGPTPQPIPTQQQIQPETPVGPGLSEMQRLVDVFVAPSKTFADLRRNSSWWVAWLVTTVFGVLVAFSITQKVDMVRLAREQIEQVKFVQQQYEQATPEKQQEMVQRQTIGLKIGLYGTPLIFLLLGLIVAAILMVVFNFGFAAEVPFGRCLAIVFYSFLPRVIGAVLLCGSLWFSSDPDSINVLQDPLATNPGFFMDPHGNKFLYGLASGLDIFAIWVCILIGIGFALNSERRKLSTGTAIGTTLAIYGVWVLVISGIKFAF